MVTGVGKNLLDTLSLACIMKLKVLLPCEGSMWSHLCGQHSATGGPPAAPMLAHSPGLATSTNLRPGLTTPTSYLGPRQLVGTGGPGQHVLAETYQALPWLRPPQASAQAQLPRGARTQEATPQVREA